MYNFCYTVVNYAHYNDVCALQQAQLSPLSITSIILLQVLLANMSFSAKSVVVSAK